MDKALRNIAFILVDGFSLMSLSAAIEPLRAANHLSGTELYKVTFVSADPRRARGSYGSLFDGPFLASAGFDFDLIMVAAAGNPMIYHNPDLLKYLRIANSKRVPLGGISGGPVLLAKAGVMENRHFTVHWDHFEPLKEFDDQLLVEKSLYRIDRDRYSCAGGVAPLDMMSAIIRQDHGADLAKAVNDWFVYTSVRDASQPQRVGLVEKYNVHHPAVLSAIELMQNHMADPLSSKQLALLSDISERQLERLFKKNLSQTPSRFYRELRLEHARVLVEQSALTIAEIAVATGFESASYLSQKYKGAYGSTPAKMREQSRL